MGIYGDLSDILYNMYFVAVNLLRFRTERKQNNSLTLSLLQRKYEMMSDAATNYFDNNKCTLYR